MLPLLLYLVSHIRSLRILNELLVLPFIKLLNILTVTARVLKLFLTFGSRLQLLIILKSEFITLMDHLLLVVTILEGIHSDVSFKEIRMLACSMASVVV